ncbi:MAG: hypothetical protein P8123_08275 [bacterium]
MQDHDNVWQEWSRHYDVIQWTVTTIIMTVVGGLLVYQWDSSHYSLELAVLGLGLTWLNMYYAASLRGMRHKLHEAIKDQGIRTHLMARNPLPQWIVFTLTQGIIAALWLYLMEKHVVPTREEIPIVLTIMMLAAITSTIFFGLYHSGKNKSR